MQPQNVQPQKWSNTEVIYSDSSELFSAVWGEYEGDECLGMRWDGKSHEPGYPQQGGNPLWFVAPYFLTLSILERLLTSASERSLANPAGQPYTDKIKEAIRRFTLK